MKPSLQRTTTTEGEQVEAELLKHKKYLHVLKFRRAALVVLAANRLAHTVAKGEKNTKVPTRYGKRLGSHGTSPSVLGQSIDRSVYTATASAMLGSQFHLLSCLTLIPGQQFPEGSLTKLVMALLPQNSDSSKEPKLDEEGKLVLQALAELQKLAEDGPGKERADIAVRDDDSLVRFLQQGLSNIKSKYSWLHLGVPSELLSANIQYIDQLFYKDILAHENSKRIEKALLNLRQIGQLRRLLESAKEREETLLKQVASGQDDCREYEEHIKKLMGTVEELQQKETNMVPIESYEELQQAFEGKEKELETLNAKEVRQPE